jgi:hypothetical protein
VKRTEKTERAERTERGRAAGLSVFSVLSSFSAFSAFSAFSVLSVLSVLSAFSAPSSLFAQGRTAAAGRVVRPVAGDTVAVADVRVLLHRVGRAEQGPIDSARADSAGRFQFRFRADTSAIYLLSARYRGIEYFSPPVHTNPARPDTAIRLVAYDTSATAPIAVEARHIVVPRPGQDGTRSVLDLIVLRNDGTLARVSPDSMHPTWSFRLPAGAGEMQVGESDISPDAVVRVGDSVLVFAPLAPGDKQLTLEYAVTPDRGRLAFPVGPSGSPVNLLVEERGVGVSGGTLALADSQVIEGRSFRRWSGQVPPAGAVAVTWAGVDVPTWRVLAALVGAVGLALALAAWRLLRRPPPAAAPLAGPDRLLDAIAALDARYQGREPDTPADEWRAYEAERARLKAELHAALAAAAPGR